MQNSQTLSHKKTRAFQADKLTAPRNFNKLEWQWLKDYQSNVPIETTDTKKLVLEIGAGKGKHALLFADTHPDIKIIAIERTTNKFTAFKKLADEQQVQGKLTNLYPVHADAIPWTVHSLPSDSLSQIFLLYPNPEPHNPNQQWLNMPFFEFLLSRLKEGGTITVASNITSYIDTAEEQAIQTWQLQVKRQLVVRDSARTHFEIKYLERGEPCEELTITKPVGYLTRFDTF